jgi:hypothetical protein
LEVSANDADEIAERLLDARLLDFASDGTGQPRYQLHALLRVFAAECAERDDSEAVRALAIGRVLGSWRWLIGRLDALSPSGEITLSATHVPACPVDEAVAKRVSTDPGAWLEAERPRP